MTKILHKIYCLLLEEYGPQHWWPGKTKDEIIIGAVLTQNTNWQNVEKAISNLSQTDLLSLSKLAFTDVETLTAYIKPSGYYNQKALRLIDTAKALSAPSIPADLPSLRSHLLSVRGIGEETADSILLYAFGFPVFVVDAYTERIFSRLKFIVPNAAYHQIQVLFMDNLEPDAALFNEYHALIVKHGKSCCKKIPLCGSCPIRDICGYYEDNL